MDSECGQGGCGVGECIASGCVYVCVSGGNLGKGGGVYDLWWVRNAAVGLVVGKLC